MIDWTHWHNEPLLIGVLVGAAWLHALTVGPWRHRIAPDAGFPRSAAWRFGIALLVFYGAVGSPLDQIGERFLFSAHMAQHMIIVFAVAPLIVSGVPPWLADAIARLPGIGSAARILTRPLVTAVVYALSISFWHVPAAYDFALRVKVVHVAQHLMFLGTALLFWWPLISRSALLPRSAPGVQILYLVGVGALQMPVVAFLAFARVTLYPTYEFAPRLTPLSPIEDQILGGAIMGVGGMFITLGLISRAFYCWHRDSASDDHGRATHPASG